MTGVELAALRARVDELAALTAARLASLAVRSPASGASADAPGTWERTVGVTDGAAFSAALAGVLGAATGGYGSSGGVSSAAGVAGSAPSALSSGQATGPALVEAARAYLGVPYVWGGESLAEGGLDCSGLVQLALSDLGVTGVPRVARDQAQLGTPVASLAEALPGDLVVFGGGTHIGIYAGDGKMIDAPRPGKVVQLRDVYETPTAIRRILPQQAAAPEATWAVSAESAAAQRALFAALFAGVAA